MKDRPGAGAVEAGEGRAWRPLRKEPVGEEVMEHHREHRKERIGD